MGLLRTSWIAEYRGHAISVTRNELRKGIEIRVDDKVVAEKRWSLTGLGTTGGDAELGGKRVRIEAKLTLRGRCTLTVDGEQVEARRA